MAARRSETTSQLLSALITVVTTWSSVGTQGRIAGAVGVAIPESDVRGLYTLGLSAEPLRPARLADELQLSRPTTSKMITRLVEAGLVERATTAQDGRGAVVALTPAGRTAYDRLVQAGLGIVDAALQDAGDDETRRLTAVLHRIIEGMPGST